MFLCEILKCACCFLFHDSAHCFRSRSWSDLCFRFSSSELFKTSCIRYQKSPKTEIKYVLESRVLEIMLVWTHAYHLYGLIQRWKKIKNKKLSSVWKYDIVKKALQWSSEENEFSRDCMITLKKKKKKKKNTFLLWFKSEENWKVDDQQKMTCYTQEITY